MNKELTDEQITNVLENLCLNVPHHPGSRKLLLTTYRAVIAADRTLQDARHAEELAAADLTISNLRAAQGVPESAILQRVKYHWFEADPDIPGDVGDYEIFGQDIPCEDGCIDALIVRADMLAAAPQPTPEESSAVAQPERKPIAWARK